MNSEGSSNNPYHPVPNTAQWAQDNIPTTFIDSPRIAKRTRAWVLLIVPAMFLLIIITLLCTMVIWLLYCHVDFDPSFGYVTNNALVVDEAAQWCQLLAIASHGNCKLNQAPSLLGLTLSGVLVSRAIYFSWINRQLTTLWIFLIEQDHLLQRHIHYGYGHPVCRIELVEGYFCQRNAQNADAPAVSKTQILSLSVGHNS